MEHIEKKKLILIGGGNRGNSYTKIGKDLGKFEVVAIAEPLKIRRDYLANLHGVPDEMCFESWEPLLALGKIADAAIISPMDRDHFAPAMAAIEAGYDLLLEKPAAPTLEECRALDKAATEKGVRVLVCHVLRYNKFFRAIKKMVDDGKVGKIINIEHTECVGDMHYSHSYVRGKWHNAEESSFMLLAKSCHDIDIIQWLIGKECKRVQSFGSLTYFKRENAPDDSTERCYDGCPHIDTCPYSAKTIYVERKDLGNWLRSSVTRCHEMTDDETVIEALAKTQYGKCVFKCDNNNVVDHQTVNMEFEDDITVTFTMSAFNLGGRRIRIMGTKGMIDAHAWESEITYQNLLTQQTEKINVNDMILGDSILSGHGGGDSGIMNSLYDMLTGKTDPEDLSNLSISIKNHTTVFAAEKSRLEGRVVEISELD